MEITIIILLILLNGILSMSEIAMVSARKSRLETAAKKGSKAAEPDHEAHQHRLPAPHGSSLDRE